MTQGNPNWMQNKTYAARLDRQLIINEYTEGIISGMQVAQRGAGANMSVDVNTGFGVIYGDDQANQGAYLVNCTVLENVAISAAPGSGTRLDLIYWRVNDPNAGGPAGDNSAFGVVSATSPTQPTLPTSAQPLALVTVAAGTLSITTALITDARVPSWQIGSPIPGTIIEFAGPESALPAAEGLICAGQSVVKLTEWRIFYFLGSTYGATSTNFTLPDRRGKIGVGLDNMSGSDSGTLSVANTLGAFGGEQLHTMLAAEVVGHTHQIDPPSTALATGTVTITDGGHHHTTEGTGFYLIPSSANSLANFTMGGAGSHYAIDSMAVSNAINTGNATTGITAAPSGSWSVDIAAFTSASTGSATPFNVMQPYQLVNFYVKR